MKAPAFAYAKPSTLQEAYALLDEFGERAKLLAGGQSLMPALNMRLTAPDVLIDINGIDALRGISGEAQCLRIGALTRQVEVERSALVARHLPLLAQAIPYVAHAAIRNCGTLGGSLAFADPAAEIPAVAVAMNATLVIGASTGERRVSARAFFRALYETELAPNEILLAAEFPCAPGERHVFAELSRRHGDYAVAGLALQAHMSGMRFDSADPVFLGGNPAPRLASRVAAALIGNVCDRDTIDRAVAEVARDLDPLSDIYHTRETKLHLAGVVLRRALTVLAG